MYLKYIKRAGKNTRNYLFIIPLILIITYISILSTVLSVIFPVFSQNEDLFNIPPEIDPARDITYYESDWKLRLGLGWDNVIEKRNIDFVNTETDSSGTKFDLAYSTWKEFNKKARLSFDNSTYYTSRMISSINYLNYRYDFNPRYSMDFGFNYEYLDDYTASEWDYSRSNTSFGFLYHPNPRLSMSFKNYWESWRYRLEDLLRPDRQRNTFVWDLNYNVGKIWAYSAISLVNDDFDNDSSRNSYEKRYTLNFDYRISPWTRIEIDQEFEQLQYGRGNYEDDVSENDFSLAFWHSFDCRVDMELKVRTENQKYDNRNSVSFNNHTDWILPKLRYNFTNSAYIESGMKYGSREYLDSLDDDGLTMIDAGVYDYETREKFLRLGYTLPRVWTGIEGFAGQKEMTRAQSPGNTDYDTLGLKTWFTFYFTPELNIELFYDYSKRENYTYKEYDEELHNANFKLNWSVR